jgi:hypothetical protein
LQAGANDLGPVRVERGAAVHVTVRVGPHSRRPLVYGELQRVDEPSYTRAFMLQEHDGEARVTGLLPGRWRVRLNALHQDVRYAKTLEIGDDETIDLPLEVR